MNPTSNDPVPTPPAPQDEPDATAQPPVSPAPDAPVAPEAQAPSETPVVPAEEVPPVSPTPTPVATPAAPVEPVTANDQPTNPFTTNAAPVVAPAPAPQPPKSSQPSKKTILIIAITAGVVVLGAILALLYFMVFSVSAKDYREAALQYDKVRSANSDLGSSIQSLGSASGSTTDSSFDSRMQDAEDSLATIKKENEALSKLKAVRVGEGGALYNTFNDKLNKYLTYSGDMVTSIKNLRPALTACTKATESTADKDALIAGLKSCSKDISGVSNLPNEDVKTLVKSFGDNYKKYADIYEQVAALKSPFGADYAQYKTLRDQLYNVQDAITADGKTFRDNIKKHTDEIGVKDAADKLDGFLSDKQKS